MTQGDRRIDARKCPGLMPEDLTDRHLNVKEREQRLLVDVGEVFSRLSEPSAFLNAIMRRVAQFFNVSRCGYARVELPTGQIIVDSDYSKDGRSIVGVFPISEYATHFLDDGGAGRVSAVNDVKIDPRTAAVYERFAPLGIRAHINVPLLRDGHWVANFWISDNEPRSWNAEEIAFMRVLADRVWLAVENSRFAAELRESHKKLAQELAASRRLQQVSIELIQEENIQALYEKILDAAAAIMHSQFASIQMLEEGANGAELRLLGHRGFSPKAADFWDKVRADAQFSCSELGRGERVIVSDLGKCDFIAGSADLRAYLEEGIHAVQSTPLISRSGVVVGMISTHWREPHEFSEGELRLFDVLARQAADLIERTNSENALKMREQEIERARDYAESTLRTSPVPLLVLKEGLTVETANDAFYEVFHIERQETEGRPVYELGNGQWNSPKLRELLEDILPHQSWFRDFEVTHEFEHIGERTMLLNARRMEREAGTPDRIVLVIEDITQRKNAEAALRDSEDKLRRIFEAAKDYAILSMDVEGRFNAWNPGAEEIFGYAQSEALGRHFSFIFSPDDREADIPAKELARAREKGCAENERWHLRKDGTRIFASGLTQPIFQNGSNTVVGYTKICQDRTEHHRTREALRESEERYRSLFECIDEGFCVIEVIFDDQSRAVDYRFLEVNPAFEQHTALVDARGKRMREMIPTHDPHWFETYGKVALTGEAIRFENYSESMQRWFNVYAFSVGQPNEHKVALLFANISDRKRSEEALRQSQRELAAANEQLASRAKHLDALVEERTTNLREAIGELEAFSYSMAHDLRGPLRAMQGYANALRDDCSEKLNDTGKTYIERIGSAAERMHRLIADVLTYSRISSQPIALETVELHSILRDILEQYPTLIDADIRVADTLPPVLGNRALLTQILSNMLTNAVKFVPLDRLPQIDVSAKEVTDSIVLSIRDNGVGIAPENQERIFRIFERVHSEKTFEGTGIGLAIVWRGVQRMGGTVGVESKIGEGSRFWVRLGKPGGSEPQ